MGNSAVVRKGSVDKTLSKHRLQVQSASTRGWWLAALALCAAVAGVAQQTSWVRADDPPPKQREAASKPAGQAPPQPKTVPRESASPPEPIDRQPYRIEIHLAFDPSARIDKARRAIMLRQWQALVHRFVGPPWSISIAGSPSPLVSGDLEALDADAFARFDPAFDKIWLIRISAGAAGSGLVFSGREYDPATRRLGALQKSQAFVLADAARALLQFSLELFNPTAVITGQEGGRALLLVRGASITPASELGRVVSQGTVFVPIRLVTKLDNTILIRRVLDTYLPVEHVEGPIARCAIVSGIHDPLTNRIARPNSLAAVGIKPGNSTLHLRFVSRPSKAPAAGYTLIARSLSDAPPRELGMTDRAGRIALKPGFANGLVILRLVAANAEPMIEFPIMPGERSDQRELAIDPKPLTVSYQVQLDALRDQVIDLVAQRSRLEKRLEARLQGEDFEGLDQGLKEFAQLPRKELYTEQLNSLKDQAAKQQDQTKTAVLTKNIQARFSELQALIDRYLEDDVFTSYAEALQTKRAEREGAAKTKAAQQKATRRRVPPDTPAVEPKAVPTSPAPDTSPL
jgi:hypothetical protein